MSKKSMYFSIEDMTNDNSNNKIKNGIDELNGIITVSVNVVSEIVAVDYDDTAVSSDDIKLRIEEIGFSAKIISEGE